MQEKKFLGGKTILKSDEIKSMDHTRTFRVMNKQRLSFAKWSW